MKVCLVTPAPAGSLAGNRVTADRWAGLLRQLGHEVDTTESWHGEPCDVLVALHARRSADSLERAARDRPELPRIVVLTGTDLYRDLPAGDRAARRSLEQAHLLVGLHAKVASALPDDVDDDVRRKVRVIYQSAEPAPVTVPPRRDAFQVTVLAHLRPVKDPLLASRAAALLPAASEIEIVHAGGEIDAESVEGVRRATGAVARYRWVGPLSRPEAMELLAGSRLLLVTSKMEGAANVVSEALALGVPVLSTAIEGTEGVLGEDYPGLFPVGDAAALASLLRRAETDAAFLRELAERCRAVRHLVTPERERRDWAALLEEATAP